MRAVARMQSMGVAFPSTRVDVKAGMEWLTLNIDTLRLSPQFCTGRSGICLI